MALTRFDDIGDKAVRGWSCAPAKNIPPKALREDLADGQLALLALNGNERAFARLVCRHRLYLEQVVARRLREPADAADVVQQTLIAAWLALGSYDVSRPFRSWLATIGINKCRDHGRRSATYATALASFGNEMMCAPFAPAIDEAVEMRATLAAAHETIRVLPDHLRRPLCASVMGDMPHAAIAADSGVTAKAVETRIRRARYRLRQAVPFR